MIDYCAYICQNKTQSIHKIVNTWTHDLLKFNNHEKTQSDIYMHCIVVTSIIIFPKLLEFETNNHESSLLIT